jgi:coenzyme Q-binding protein COQ10
MANTTYDISLSHDLHQSTSIAYKVVEDLERFPEFMPNVNSLVLLESEGNRKVAAWDIMIDDAPLDWIEEGIYDKDNMIVHFRSLEGVFDRFDGFWQVSKTDEGSRVTFQLTYEIGLPEIEDIVGPILRDRMIDNVESMLEAIEKWVEETT